MIRCHLSHLVLDEEADQQTVFITETGSERCFPITIGRTEALAIDRALRGQVFPRPLTHDLLMATIVALGGRLMEVRIVDVRNGTFFAVLAIRQDDGSETEIDCRPSDALACLARQPGTPLQVAEAVIDELG